MDRSETTKQNIYNAIKSLGEIKNLPDFDTFKKDLETNESVAKNVHSYMQSSGINNVPNFDGFIKDMGLNLNNPVRGVSTIDDRPENALDGYRENIAKYNAHNALSNDVLKQVEAAKAKNKTERHDAYKEHIQSEFDKDEKMRKDHPFIYMFMNGKNNTIPKNPRAKDDKINSLEATKNILDETGELIAEGKKKGTTDDKWYYNAGRGFKSKAFDLSTWDGGLTDAFDAGSVYGISKKLQKGEPLTQSEMDLANALALSNAAKSAYGETSRW